MKAITNSGPGKLEFIDWPLPQPGHGQVRIKTSACGICATDMHMIAGWARTGYPSIPGHEWSGTVDVVGAGVDVSLIGLRCVGENALSTGGEVGFEYPGGYGEYFITEAGKIYPLPGNFPLPTATLMEPLAVSVRAINKLKIEGSNRALIFGDGPIGLLTLMLLNHVGVKDTFMVGGRDSRLNLACEIGARQTLNYHLSEDNLETDVTKKFGAYFPIVVEASGSLAAMQASINLVQLCGQILVLGDYANARADFEWNQLLHQEIELLGSNASAGAWPEAVRLAIEGVIPLERLVTHRLPIERFAEGIDITRSKQADVIKVVLDWNM